MTTPTPPPPARLTVRGLLHSYRPGSPILDVPRLTVEGGDITGLAGGNGAGKTTLLELLGQLRPLQSGQIIYEYSRSCVRRVVCFPGDCAAELFRHDAVGFLFARHALLPGLSALDNAALPLTLASQPPDEARRRLAEVDLPPAFWGKLPAVRSTGQNQRAAVARALASSPPLLIVDEGTNGLDPQSSETVMKLLHDHAQRGNMVLFVSHNVDLLARWCGRVLVLHQGRIVYPFADDPDDPAPAGAGLFGEARPSPSLVGKVGSCPAVARRLREALYEYLTPRTPPGSPPIPHPPITVAIPASPPRRGARLGCNAVRMAVREVFTTRHLGRRMALAGLMAVTVACLLLISLLVRGVVWRTRTNVLSNTPLLTPVEVRPKDGRGGLTREQLAYLAGVEGVQTVSRRQSLRNFRLFKAGSDDTLYAVAESVAPGDPLLKPIPAGTFSTAERGVEYLSGNSFTPAMHDRAGVLLSEEIVRDLGYTGLPPATVDLYSHREESDGRELKSFDGRLPLPVVGVFRYPPALLRQTNGGRGLARAYLPEGFLARLARPKEWQAGFAYRYPSALTGKPLLDDVTVVTGVSVRLRPGASANAFRQWMLKPFGYPRPHVDVGNDLVAMRLDFKRRPCERIAEEDFRQQAGEPPHEADEIKVDGEPVTRFIDEVPPQDDEQLMFGRAILSVADIDRVIPVQKRIAAERSDLDVFVRNHEAIARLGSLRAVADWSSGVLSAVLLAGLLFFVVIATYQHVAAKSPEAAVLRAHGLGAWQVGLLHGLELALQLLPAYLLGLALALGTAYACDDWVADRLAEIEAAGRGDGVEAGHRVPAFLSRQVGPLEAAREMSVTLLAIMASMSGSTALAACAIAGRDVASGLRSDPT
ncbi:MAG TPA: ATP-binding cassette domain-containing protein [Gemmataceae bacterium]|nr:ATP-binding cassette domain-containing protein [Gemmataceae bacterium]